MFKLLSIYIIFFIWFNYVKTQCLPEALLYGCVFPLPSNDFISGGGTTKLLFSEHIVFSILTGGAFIVLALTIMWGLVLGIWGISFFWIVIIIIKHFFTDSFKLFSLFPLIVGMVLALNLWLMVKPFRIKTRI